MTAVTRRAALTLLGGFAAGATGTAAHSQTVEQFYKGHQITMVVGNAPGGINDISARFVARYLGKYIPGHPTIVVENQPGAGGIIAANRLANVFPKDGTYLAKLERAVPLLAIQGDPNVQFDPLKLTWLGSLSSYANDAYLMMVMATNPIKSVDELKGTKKSISLGGDNAASSNVIYATIAKKILGLNIKVVTGYRGAAPMFLAMQRGEIDGQVVGYSSVRTGQRTLWSEHAFRALMQFGRKTRHPDFANIPTAYELTKDPAARALLSFADLQFFISLPFAAPPDIPADRAAALQKAFMAMCKDPDVAAAAQKLGIDLSPIDAAAVHDAIAKAAATPRDVIAHYNKLVGPNRH
jgi:tripartite-type tricarboxylate transporter receptor subunit TctC